MEPAPSAGASESAAAAAAAAAPAPPTGAPPGADALPLAARLERARIVVEALKERLAGMVAVKTADLDG
jgi:hypothetical protein